MAAAGLVSPEIEIVDSEYSIQLPNLISVLLYRDVATLPQPPTGLSPFLEPDYSALLPKINDPPALVDQLDLLFCANHMTAGTRATIISALQSIAAESELDRLKTAIQLTVLSPDAALQQ